MILESRAKLRDKDKYVGDLEEYIDRLLVKVIDAQPRILQNPYPSPTVQCHRPRQYNSTSALSSGHSGLVLGVSTGIPVYTNSTTTGVASTQPRYSTLPAYGGNSAMVTKNNNRNSMMQAQQQYTTGTNRSRMSPPKVIRAGQNNTKKKSTNPFKRITSALKN